MIVICKTANKQLLKGHKYEVLNMYNDGVHRLDGNIQIKNIGWCRTKNFTDINGDDLPQSNYITNTDQVDTYIKFEDIKEGDILVCTSDKFKSFVKGGMYRIKELSISFKSVTSWNGNVYQVDDRSVKYVGINRNFKFNGYDFRKLTSKETRELSLLKVLDDEAPNIILDQSSFRKIDLVSDKDDVLLKNLAKSILDPNRHHLSIVQWAITKNGDKLKLIEDDYTPYLNMTLSEILSKIK